MTVLAASIILFTTLITAFVSGIFGMAGGLILMGVLVAVTSVPQAMIIHGAIQFVSNGWRAFLLREHISSALILRYLVGAAVSVVILSFIAWKPNKTILYFLLGLLPLIIWIPKRWFHLNVQRPRDNYLSGFLVCGLNTLAGVAGPMLDIFFVQTNMTRKEIVANKSTTQAVAHLVKIGFWTGPAIMAHGTSAIPPLWFFAAAIPLSMLGTWLGGIVLHHMTDINFVRWMKGLVTVIGGVFLLRAAGVF